MNSPGQEFRAPAVNRGRITGLLIAAGAGILLSWYAYERVTDPLPRLERQREEAVVLRARDLLRGYVALSAELEIVDPLARNRVAGKVYIYPVEDGWQVSGHYRRPGDVFWRPWLMTLDREHGLRSLKVEDGHPAILARAAGDPRFEALPRAARP